MSRVWNRIKLSVVAVSIVVLAAAGCTMPEQGHNLSRNVDEVTAIQCLQMQNEWIDDCMSGISGWWTSLTGQLDDCIADFDANHPECVSGGFGAAEAAQEVHEAYGPAGEIIGGALGIIGGVVIDAVHCAGGAFMGMYVLTEAGYIWVTGDNYGDYSISDEALEEAEAACWSTSQNAVVFAAAIVAPQVVAGYISIHLVDEMYECYEACMAPGADYYECTQQCYSMGAEALAVLGFIELGRAGAEYLPPEMLAPEAFGIRPPWAPTNPGAQPLDPRNFPRDPVTLEEYGFVDTTHPQMAQNTTSLEYTNPETGQIIRFDPARPGANGWEGIDHYHNYNPESTGRGDLYLDADGIPVPRGSNASHIPPELNGPPPPPPGSTPPPGDTGDELLDEPPFVDGEDPLMP